MKKVLILLIVNIFLVLIQGSFLRELMGSAFMPNLVVAFAFAFFFADREDLALTSAFIGGLLQDLFGFSIVGISSLVIIGALIFFKFVKQYLFRGWMANFILVFLTQVLYVSVLSGFSRPGGELLYTGISTLLFSIFLFLANEKVLSYFKKPGYLS